MAEERIEKTLTIFKEGEVCRLLEPAQRNDDEEIQQYMLKLFIKKVEAVLRRRDR